MRDEQIDRSMHIYNDHCECHSENEKLKFSLKAADRDCELTLQSKDAEISRLKAEVEGYSIASQALTMTVDKLDEALKSKDVRIALLEKELQDYRAVVKAGEEG